jgi:class 3 adenylate cyclase
MDASRRNGSAFLSVHTGLVLFRDNDITGRDVNIASRLLETKPQDATLDASIRLSTDAMAEIQLRKRDEHVSLAWQKLPVTLKDYAEPGQFIWVLPVPDGCAEPPKAAPDAAKSV